MYVSNPTVTYVKEDPVVEKPVSNKENKSKAEPVEETKSNTSTQDDIDLTSERPRRKPNLSYEETITPDVEEETVTETPQLTEEEISTNNTLIDDWLGLDGAPKVLTRE